MRQGWEDLAARACGLSTRLLGGARLRALAREGNLADLARALGAPAQPARGEAVTAPSLDAVARARGAALLAILARRAGARARVLDIVFEDEDRRSIGALLRGAAAGTPRAARLAGVVATPALPPRTLELLAAQPNAAGVAARLAELGSPYGAALLPDAQRERPNLFALERRLDAVFAARVAARARRGDHPLRRLVRLRLDVANAWTALVLAGGGSPADAGERSALARESFVEGGRRLPRDRCAEAAGADGRAAAMDRLAPLFDRTPLGDALRAHAPLATLDDAALRWALAVVRRDARREPLGTARVLAFVLRLRAELRDLRRLAWGLALGVPRDRLERALVSP